MSTALPNTEAATQAGLDRAFAYMRREYPELSAMEIELEVVAAARDWKAGREGDVQDRLSKRYGVIVALRLLAELLADAEPAVVTGMTFPKGNPPEWGETDGA